MFLEDQEPDEPLPLRAALAGLSARLGLARPDTAAVLERHWRQLVGSDLAGLCRLRGLRDGVLLISVDDPVLVDHLRWMRGDLIMAANDICGSDTVKDLRVTVSRDASRG